MFAQAVGLDTEKARTFIRDDAHQKETFNRAVNWSQRGVTGEVLVSRAQCCMSHDLDPIL